MISMSKLIDMKALYKWLIVGFVFIGPVSMAQQQIMFSQYMFNGLSINPAYAGSQESISLTAMMRPLIRQASILRSNNATIYLRAAHPGFIFIR